MCNNRFWAWITFEKAYKQAIASLQLKETIVKNWWLIGSSRRSLMLGVISREFFGVEVSVDYSNDDAYYLTRYMFSSIDEVYRNIVFRNIGMLKNVTLSYLSVLKNYSETNDYIIGVQDCRELFKCASKLGSVMLIDIMDRDAIYNALCPKLEKSIHSM